MDFNCSRQVGDLQMVGDFKILHRQPEMTLWIVVHKHQRAQAMMNTPWL